MSNQQDLEDIIQETYVQAYKSWDSLLDVRAEMAWLFTIGRRQWGQLLERKKRQVVSGFDLSSEEIQKLEGIDQHSSADVQLDARHLCDQVTDLISGVKDQIKRQALTMYYLQEATLPEIHDTLQVNQSTLTTWLSRFRVELKQLVSSRERTSR